MKTYKINDPVRILKYPKDHINGRARVIEVTNNGVYVANMNMPFQGTFSREFFCFDEIE